MRKVTALILAAIMAVLLLGAESCESKPTAQDQEQARKAQGIDGLIQKQPAPAMKYSPTRATIIAWAKEWEVPGKLAYTYITQGPNDPKGGYYVFVGPPVSYCVALTNPQQKVSIDTGDYGGEALGTAPGIDGAYGGGDCSVFYGIDAVTKTPVTFSVGLGQNLFYTSQPNLRYKNAEPLGTATVQAAKKKN